MRWLAAQQFALLLTGLLLVAGCSSQTGDAGGGASGPNTTVATHTVVYEVPGMH